MNDSTKKHQRGSDYPQGFAVGYLYSTVQNTIDHLCATASEQLSKTELATRLGHLLLSQTGGSLLGPSDSVQQVRGETGKRSKTVAKVEVVGRPRGRKPLTDQERQWVRDYLSNGKSVAWIAAKLHRHESTIHVLRNELNKQNPITEPKRKRNYNGKHWTQLPGGREKLKKIQKARWSDDQEMPQTA